MQCERMFYSCQGRFKFNSDKRTLPSTHSLPTPPYSSMHVYLVANKQNLQLIAERERRLMCHSLILMQSFGLFSSINGQMDGKLFFKASRYFFF